MNARMHSRETASAEECFGIENVLMYSFIIIGDGGGAWGEKVAVYHWINITMEIDIEFVPKEWVFKLVSKDSIILLQLCQAGFNSALYYANKQQITAIIVSSCNKLWLFYYSLTLRPSKKIF